MEKIKIYGRVSTDEQNVIQQVKLATNHFSNPGFEVTGVVADTESGRKPLIERRKFKKLLIKAKEQGFSIGVHSIDRLTRNWDDVTFIERFFRENWERCKLRSMSEPVDLSSATGRFSFRIMMTLACFMPEQMRERQKVGIARAKKEGRYKGRKRGSKNK